MLLTVARPISAMTEAMGRRANDDLDAEIPGLNRRDEIGAMDQAVTAVTVAIEEQNASSEEISRNITHTASAAEQVTAIIRTVQEKAKSNGESSDVVMGSAAELATLAKTITESVDAFLRRIRADNRMNEAARDGATTPDARPANSPDISIAA